MQTIFNNGTISASDYTILDGFNTQIVSLLINIKNAPTGTNPSVTFTVADVDPIDTVTVVGNSLTTSALISASTAYVVLRNSISPYIKVSWVLDGYNSPEFTGVNVVATSLDGSFLLSNASTCSNVSASASSVTLLTANQNRTSAAIFNDSTDNLYIKLGATASTSSFTVKVLAGGYYEVPFNYLGLIDGIWSGTNGAVRITEFINATL